MALTSFQICWTPNRAYKSLPKTAAAATATDGIYEYTWEAQFHQQLRLQFLNIIFFFSLSRNDYIFEQMIRFKRKFSKTYHMTGLDIASLNSKFAVGLRLKKELKNDDEKKG